MFPPRSLAVYVLINLFPAHAEVYRRFGETTIHNYGSDRRHDLGGGCGHERGAGYSCDR
jgi:hypothetical protein